MVDLNSGTTATSAGSISVHARIKQKQSPLASGSRPTTLASGLGGRHASLIGSEKKAQQASGGLAELLGQECADGDGLDVPLTKPESKPFKNLVASRGAVFNHDKKRLERLYSTRVEDTITSTQKRRRERSLLSNLTTNLDFSTSVKAQFNPNRREHLFKHDRNSSSTRRRADEKDFQNVLKPAPGHNLARKLSDESLGHGDPTNAMAQNFPLPPLHENVTRSNESSPRLPRKSIPSIDSATEILQGVKPRVSTSFNSFTHQGLAWEQHLLNNVSKSTAEWLVLEKTKDREQRLKLASLMNMDPNRRDVQLVSETVKSKELEALTKEQQFRSDKAANFEAKKSREAGAVEIDEMVTLGNLVKSGGGEGGLKLAKAGLVAFDVDADTEGTNYTAQWVENVLKEHKSKQRDTKKDKTQKGIQTYLENKCAVQIQDEKMTVKKSLDNKNAIGTFELALEEKFPPNKHKSMNKTGFRKWMDLPKRHERNSLAGRAERKFSTDGQSRTSSKRKVILVDEPISGPFALVKEWARNLKFATSWQQVTIQDITTLLLDIHEAANLQALVYVLLAITSQESIEFPESLVSLIKSRVIKSPRYQMAFKLVEVLQDKTRAQAVLEYLLPKLDPQDEFFLSQFILSLKDLTLDTTMRNQLVDNITRVIFEPEKYIIGQNKSRKVMSRTNDLLIEQCKENDEAAKVVVNVAGERLQSVRMNERCLALELIKNCGRGADNISHCILERMNHLLWEDTCLEVRQQACLALEAIEANHIVYADLLNRFSNCANSTERLWCLSVVRQLRIMTAQLLPSYIACFDIADHADVRLLSCQVADDLKLTSTTVFNCLINAAQNDSANHVKAAAIKSLTNFKPTDQLLKLLTWASQFESSWAVRLAAVNAIGVLEGLKKSHDVLKIMRERAIIESNATVKERVALLLKTQMNIECKDSDLKELKLIKDQVGSLCTKEKILQILVNMQEEA